MTSRAMSSASTWRANGRSSKNYRTDGFWARALALKPTYMLISFGGNDVPGKGPERETDPKTTFYANMKRYVDEARAAGIEPILVTPMEGRKYGADGKLLLTLDAYAAAIRKVGADTKTPSDRPLRKINGVSQHIDAGAG